MKMNSSSNNIEGFCCFSSHEANLSQQHNVMKAPDLTLQCTDQTVVRKTQEGALYTWSMVASVRCHTPWKM